MIFVIQIIAGISIDDLVGVNQPFLLTYEGVGGQLGFQADEQGKRLLNNFLDGALWVSTTHLETISPHNINNVLNKITKNKYGVLIHQPKKQFKILLEELPTFYRKKVAYEIKKNKGVDSREIIEPEWLSKVCCPDRPLEGVRWLVSNCRFVSIWPKYWGEYGEHCFLVSEDADSVISDLPIIFNIDKSSIIFLRQPA
jgi:hypothetical protein